MYLVAIAWAYVVLMMAVVEALSPTGTVLGALFTVLLYGVLPLGIVMYILGAPARREARRQAEMAPVPPATVASTPSEAAQANTAGSAPEPDAGGHAGSTLGRSEAVGAPVAAEGKKA